MIKSGRNPSSGHSPIPSTNTRGAKLTAVAGALIFTVFLCSSVADEMDAQPTDSAFGEGAYQVFAPSDDSPKKRRGRFRSKRRFRMGISGKRNCTVDIR